MQDWRLIADRARDIVGTPCYVMSEPSIREAAGRLRALESSVRLRHWLSLKTQPVAKLTELALELGWGIDVVSACELHGAISAGCPAERILVNGVGKLRWLARQRIRNLVVHFDSVAEVRALAPLAKMLNWKIGLRCAIPDEASGWDQFGMTPEEIRGATTTVRNAGLAVSGLHFHLHTNVPHVACYRRALAFVANVAGEAGIEPQYLDIGGGLPVSGETPLSGPPAAETFDIGEFRALLGSLPATFASVSEVWLENGRHLSAPAGALVVTVIDRKVRDGIAYLICDGGRVNHARMAAFETHEILLTPARQGALRKTIVCGSTCGAIDRLGEWMLPDSIEPDDRLIWLNAGAYHIPLETRFSSGLSPVVWFDAHHQPTLIRPRETPEQWWGQWVATERRQGGVRGRPT